MNKLIIIFILLHHLSITAGIQQHCPPEIIIKPCKCFHNHHVKTLQCSGSKAFDLSQVFRRMSNWSTSREDSKFSEFEFENTEILSFEENLFSNITFESIIIQNKVPPNNVKMILEKIHESAFLSSAHTLKSLKIINVPKLNLRPPPYNILNLVNSMHNLSSLFFSDTSIHEIPENYLNNTNLCSIRINNLKKINNYSFNKLKYFGGKDSCKVLDIYLSGSFDYIPSHAFYIDDHDENVDLVISLHGLQLSGSSFELGAFTNAKRNINLDLANNHKLTYLDQKIFSPLFENYHESKIKLAGNPLDCNSCQFKWIFENKDQLMGKLFHAECDNGLDFYKINIDHFANCTNSNVTTDTSQFSTIPITPSLTMTESIITTTIDEETESISISDSLDSGTVTIFETSTETATFESETDPIFETNVGTTASEPESESISGINTKITTLKSGTESTSETIAKTNTKLTTSSVQEENPQFICNLNGEYDGRYGISHWPPVSSGQISEGKCIYANGSLKWVCHENGLFDQNGPDFSECLLDSLIKVNNLTDISVVMNVLELLVKQTENSDSLTNSQELKIIVHLIKLMQNFIETNDEVIDFEIALNSTTNFVHLFSNLMNQNNAWNNVSDSEQTEIASEILLYIQHSSFTLSCKQNTSNNLLEIKDKNIIVNTYYTVKSEEILFEANGSSILIPKGFDSEKRYSCNNSATAALMQRLENYLPSGVKNEQLINTEIIAFSKMNFNGKIRLINGMTARISLKHKNRLQFGDKMICVFWDFISMQWSTNGCELIVQDSNRDYSVCECNHLTNFAAIMDLSGRENNDYLKSLLTYICCGLSTICLILTILLILFREKRKLNAITDSIMKIKHKITCNLCLCLIVTNLLVIFGMDRTENKHLCQTFSGLLLYSLLASFSWMLLEGFHLYRIIDNVFSSNLKTYFIFLFGYGMPVIVYIIAFTIIWFKENIFLDILIGDYFCWISSKKYPENMWIIIGPALAMVFVNTMFISLFVKKLFSNNKKMKKDKTSKAGSKSRVFAFTSILCNLGFTWLLFILYIEQFGSYFSYFSYIFIVLNGLQGFFIFLYHSAIIMKKKLKENSYSLEGKSFSGSGKFEHIFDYYIQGYDKLKKKLSTF